MQSYLDRGYSVVKMKIGGASLGRGPASASRRCCELLGPGQRLAVDANGRFDLPTAIAYAKALSAYDLFWYEEAGDPLDYALQAELAKHYDKPMATGENLFSMQDARNLIRYGGMRPDRDWLQFDCALSYGLVEYLRTLEMLKENGWSRVALRAARRAPDVARHRRRPAASAATSPTPTCSSPTAAFPTASRSRQHRHPARAARHRLRGQGRPDPRDAGAVRLRRPARLRRGRSCGRRRGTAPRLAART